MGMLTGEHRAARQVAEEIRHLLNTYEKTIPTVLEIPSKDLPYDPAKDYIMKRVSLMLGEP
jgi:V-type H+-transporting ATPase subunit F